MNCTVIKIGGKLVENPCDLDCLCGRLVALSPPLVVVHGGGVLADELCSALSIPRHVVDGRRVTDMATLRVTVMAYAGWLNKSIVAALQRQGVNACGLSGCDERLVTACRRPATQGIDWGHVGDVSRVDASALARLIDRGITPVISPITLGDDGQLLNSNADAVAGAIASALGKRYTVDLLLCLDKKGVLVDPSDPSSFLPYLTRADREALEQQGIISAGMIPKLEYAFNALDAGARSARLLHPDDLDNEFAGTRLLVP